MFSKLFSGTRLVTERLRAHLLRLRGVNSDRKCMVGPRVRLDRPRTIQLGTRVTLEADVWIKSVDDSATVRVGDYSFLGRGVEMDVLELISIGAHALIAPNVFITDHNHNLARAQLIDQQGCTSRPVVIGDDVWLGAGAVVLPGVTIGRGAVIGAGAVVTGNVPEYEIWVGVPARPIGRRE